MAKRLLSPAAERKSGFRFDFTAAGHVADAQSSRRATRLACRTVTRPAHAARAARARREAALLPCVTLRSPERVGIGETTKPVVCIPIGFTVRSHGVPLCSPRETAPAFPSYSPLATIERLPAGDFPWAILGAIFHRVSLAPCRYITVGQQPIVTLALIGSRS